MDGLFTLGNFLKGEDDDICYSRIMKDLQKKKKKGGWGGGWGANDETRSWTTTLGVYLGMA